jgi:hypothetical protein
LIASFGIEYHAIGRPLVAPPRAAEAAARP